MKKRFLLFLICAVAISVNAQVFVENFATAPIGGNLEGYNGWYVSAKAADALGVSPKIAEGALFYTGYAGSNIGNMAVLDSAIGVSSASQRISTKIIVMGSDTLKPVVGQKIYVAFMANISSHSYRSFRDFFTFEASKTSSMTRGRIFAKNNGVGDQFSLAISKNSSSSGVYIESPNLLSTGINHLFVFCYETIEGVDNDKVSLYINPDLTKNESEQTNLITATDVATDYSATAAMGINLRQRGIGAQIGGIRVSKSWNSSLLSGIKPVNSETAVIKSYGKTIQTSTSGVLKVFNVVGTEVVSVKTNGKVVTSLNSGLYLVRFAGDDGKISLSKIAIE